MKKSAYILAILFAGALLFSSCRAQHKACAAYSKVEAPVNDQSNG